MLGAVDSLRGHLLHEREAGEARKYTPDPYPCAGYIGHYDGIIHNNVVYADVKWFDTGIELAQARGARVYHNTVFSTAAATGMFSSIDYRFMNSVVDIRNNLVIKITMRDGASGMVSANKLGATAALFRDAAKLDFHLARTATDAIDRGVSVTEAGVDMDGEAHTAGGTPDIGADELQP